MDNDTTLKKIKPEAIYKIKTANTTGCSIKKFAGLIEKVCRSANFFTVFCKLFGWPVQPFLFINLSYL